MTDLATPITEENYVQKAEACIKSLGKQDDNERLRFVLTTSKIRNLLSMVSEIYNDVQLEDDLSPKDRERIRYLKVRMIYEAGRETDRYKPVKEFIQKGKLLEMVDAAESSREKFLLLSRYFEALVAWHRYHGGND